MQANSFANNPLRAANAPLAIASVTHRVMVNELAFGIGAEDMVREQQFCRKTGAAISLIVLMCCLEYFIWLMLLCRLDFLQLNIRGS